MKKLLVTMIAVWGTFSLATAQYVDQALIFSQQNYGSTARSKAMGNAFGALGGDFSSLSINPAGIGVYQRSEFSTSVNILNYNKTKSAYQGYSSEDDSNKFNFSNLGFVGSTPMVNSSFSGLVSLNYGIGFNKLNNFNQNSQTYANYSPHSRLDAFAQNARGLTTIALNDENAFYNIPFESKLAWDNYLIDPGETLNTYVPILQYGETVDQLENSHCEGYTNEFVLSVGANFNHKLYLGATFGFQDLYFNERYSYGEDFYTTSDEKFGDFFYTYRNAYNGAGYNFKIGAIYRPIPQIRLGLAYHTPTFYKLKYEYSAEMSSTLSQVSAEADGSHYSETPYFHENMNFRTPSRLIASAAFQFGKRAMLSIDYEYLNYASIKYSGNAYADINLAIKDTYTKANNIRIGAEVRMTEHFSLRGGTEFLSNPFNDAEYKYNSYNGGLGYSNQRFSVDLAYSLGDLTTYRNIYWVENIQQDPVKEQSLRHEVMLTLGFKF